MKQIRIFTIFIMVLALIVPGLTFAYDHNTAYQEHFGTGSISNASTPYRVGDDAGGALQWIEVTSKMNQPRTDGSNPHQGTDIGGTAGRVVFPIMSGNIVDWKLPGSVNDGWVLTTHTIGGTTYRIKYLHVYPDSNLVKGGVIGTNTPIATIDIKRGAGWPPHLHLERINASTGLISKLYNFYRSSAFYRYGEDMDYISADTISGNTLYLTGYVGSNGQRYSLQEMKLYYKIGANGAWQSNPKSMTAGSNYRYSINLQTATGASVGQTVYFYVAGIRKQDSDFSGTYDYGVWPMKYKQPQVPLSATNADTLARTHYIQSGVTFEPPAEEVMSHTIR